jgi:hypothetical protein
MSLLPGGYAHTKIRARVRHGGGRFKELAVIHNFDCYMGSARQRSRTFQEAAIAAKFGDISSSLEAFASTLFTCRRLTMEEVVNSQFPRSSIPFLFLTCFDTQGASPKRTLLHEGKKDGNENQDVNR